MKPIITIGVCVKDSAPTLNQAIDSILYQDFPHELIEVIFVDDGSKDSTLSIIKSYIPRLDMVTKVFHHEWKGLGFSRNVVINNTGGKYIVWLDGDMILQSNNLRALYEFMEKNPNAGIAKAKYGLRNNDKTISYLENIGYVAVDSIFGGSCTERPLGTGGAIYRFDAVKMVGGFDSYLKGVGEDMDIEYRIRKVGWSLFLGAPAIFYEQRRSSMQALWREAYWHGKGGHDVFTKDKSQFALYKMTPIAGFFAGVWYSIIAYKLTRRKLVFLLPLHYTLKRIAWCIGFFKGKGK